jgi:hypothetical protein
MVAFFYKYGPIIYDFLDKPKKIEKEFEFIAGGELHNPEN